MVFLECDIVGLRVVDVVDEVGGLLDFLVVHGLADLVKGRGVLHF